MRKVTILDALFPRTRQNILSTLLVNPERAWFLSDLARQLSTTPSSLQRELSALARAEILLKTQDGNRTYYRANSASPVLPELRGLLIKTTGLVDQVRGALESISSGIRFAFIFGSFAANAEHSSSDVDLLLVGSTNLMDLVRMLRPLEARLQRPINPSLYSEVEFAEKVSSGRHFLTAILNGPKLFILGTERDVESIAERGPADPAPNE